MKKGHMPYGAMIILFVAFLLFTSCAQVESGVSGLLGNTPQKASLQEKAFAYMTESYGDVFEYDGHPNTSRGSSQQIERTVYLKVTGHPYDYILVVSPWYDDGKGKTLLTDYPHYLFGNEAGPIWGGILGAAFPKMGYLPPEWKFITQEEHDSQTYTNVSGSWARTLGEMTRDSSVEDYMEASPIYGMLVLPESGHLPYELETYKNRGFIEVDGFILELDGIDPKYDLFLYVILLEDDFFEELYISGDPAEQLFLQYGYTYNEKRDPLEYARREPNLSINRSFKSLDIKNRISAIIQYIRREGELTIKVD